MIPRMKYARILAGMGALIAVLSTGIEVYAAGSVIKVTGGYKPGTGDPPFDYIFQAFLEPPPNPPGGMNFIASTDFFTITGLTGVTSGSLTSQPGNGPATVWQPTPGADSVTWTFFGNQNIVATTQEIPLGQFVVETTTSYPLTAPPIAAGTIIDYFFSYDGGTATGTGEFPLTNLSVPEPSSIIMLLAGVGALPVFLIRERKRRQRRSLQPA
jgi:PEP-CTERM motif